MLPAAAVLPAILLVTSAMAAEKIDLVWHAETLSGKALMSKAPDRLVNPASVVKVASSYRALELLGPQHRFETVFAAEGDGKRKGDKLAGGLVLVGGNDPDFHFENALLVAHELNRLGIHEVDGDVFVNDRFWMNWERGAAGREPDPQKRALSMAQRLIDAWDPSRWGGEEKLAWSTLAPRRGWSTDQAPAVVVKGQPRLGAPPSNKPLLVHRSGPLVVALRRFNVFSNNDIERLDASAGGPAQLASFLSQRWGEAAAGVRFETTSGLNSNRMSPRQIVRLVRDLHALLQRHGLTIASILPVIGCGPSTLRELFPRLRDSGVADGTAGKTGTLNTTDGGVSALAGVVPAAAEPVLFFVAAPGAGHALGQARAAEEDWLERLLRQVGMLSKPACPPPLPMSDEHAEVVPAAPPAP